MDGRTRQNPAYRPANGKPRPRGAFLSLVIVAVAIPVAAGADRVAAGPTGPTGGDPDAWRPDVQRARTYAMRRTGEVRFAIVDPARRSRDFHGGRTAPMASTVKVMLLAADLRQRSVRDRSLHESDRDLLGPMIRRSDNGAATRVRNIVGERAIRRLANDSHMRRFRYSSSWGDCRTSAA